jgi:hypothetical protein
MTKHLYAHQRIEFAPGTGYILRHGMHNRTLRLPPFVKLRAYSRQHHEQWILVGNHPRMDYQPWAKAAAEYWCR